MKFQKNIFLPLTLTVYKWNRMEPLWSIWFHLYTVKIKGQFRPPKGLSMESTLRTTRAVVLNVDSRL